MSSGAAQVRVLAGERGDDVGGAGERGVAQQSKMAARVRAAGADAAATAV